MRSDPLGRLPTWLRLWAAAALCVLPLGLLWPARPGPLSLGYTLYGDCNYTANEYCTPAAFVPGSYLPGHAVLAAQAPARVFLVFAAVVVAHAGSRVRTAATRRFVRAATAALGIVAALALADHAILPLVCVLLALALVAPLVWRAPSAPAGAVFVPGAIHR